MIQLSGNEYAYLAAPPTHAVCVSVNGAYQPWANGVRFLKLNYQFGIYASGVFTPNHYVPVLEITFPSVQTNIPTETQMTYLENLFGEGIAPNASDPTQSVSVPSKKTFDFKIQDIEAIVMKSIPALAGTYVAI